MISTDFTRRRVLAGTAAALAVAGLPVGALAQARSVPDGAVVNVTELMKPGAMGDNFIGSADAPVTLIEYASMTCPHCAAFHATTFPALKEKYIDTGKVRFVLREFPLDPLAAAGFMLARCAGEGKYYPMVDLLFQQQKVWAYSDKPLDGLFATVRQAGFTQGTFEACLNDQKAYEAVNGSRQRASDQFGVDSTPTFFINGKITRGAFTAAEMDRLLAPFLPT